MNVQIKGTSSPALEEHVKTQMDSALVAALDRVDSVVVTLEDLNGPSKGHDKRAHIRVLIKSEEPLIIEEINDDMYNAVSKAAHRLKNVLNKKHDKRLEKLHGH